MSPKSSKNDTKIIEQIPPQSIKNNPKLSKNDIKIIKMLENTPKLRIQIFENIFETRL